MRSAARRRTPDCRNHAGSQPILDVSSYDGRMRYAPDCSWTGVAQKKRNLPKWRHIGTVDVLLYEQFNRDVRREDVPVGISSKNKSSVVESACRIARLKATAVAPEASEAQKERVNVPSPKRGDVCSLGNQLKRRFALVAPSSTPTPKNGL